MDKQQYQALMEAVWILQHARWETWLAGGSVPSPAWAMVVDAQTYLFAQANSLLRSSE